MILSFSIVSADAYIDGANNWLEGTTTLDTLVLNNAISDLDVTTNIDTATLTTTGTATLNDLDVTTNIDTATLSTTGLITSDSITVDEIGINHASDEVYILYVAGQSWFTDLMWVDSNIISTGDISATSGTLISSALSVSGTATLNDLDMEGSGDTTIYIEGGAGSDAVIRLDSDESILNAGRYSIVSESTSRDFLITQGTGNIGMSMSSGLGIWFPAVYGDPIGATNRDLYIDDTGQIGYISSSIRYKENIAPIYSSSWIYDLVPVSYNYISDPTKRYQEGLIAEEVEKINPTIVSYNENNEVETVSYSKLIVPMLKELQTLRQEIEQLKNACN